MSDTTASTSARVYVDMVGDLFHAGHVELLRAARARGEWLVVGVLSDEAAAAYKRRPITCLAERVAVIEACRYVDEVIADAPFQVDEAFLVEHDIAIVVHGDDLTPQGVQAVYGAAAAAGKLELVPRTSEISTTELIRRVLEVNASGSLGIQSPAEAVLLHLNGPPGVGKSALAQRFVDEHEGALNLDIDKLVPLIGGGQHDFFGALEPARRLAVAMAETHLRAGHDVVLPQLVNDVAEARRFERVAAEASATYVEVVLSVAAPVHIRRFREKSARSDLDRHVADAVEGEGGDVFLERMHREFGEYAGLRPGARRIETDDLSLDRAYAAVLRALSEVTGPGARDGRRGPRN